MSKVGSKHPSSVSRDDRCLSGDHLDTARPDYPVSSRMPQPQSFKFIARSAKRSEDNILWPGRQTDATDDLGLQQQSNRPVYYGKAVFNSGESVPTGDCIQIPKIFSTRPGIASRKSPGDLAQLNSASTKGTTESQDAAGYCQEACSPEIDEEQLLYPNEAGQEDQHLHSNISIGGSEGSNELPEFRIETYSYKNDQRPRSATSLQEDNESAGRIDTNIDCDSLLRRNDHFVEFLQTKRSAASPVKSPVETSLAHPYTLASTKKHSKSVHEAINGFGLV